MKLKPVERVCYDLFPDYSVFANFAKNLPIDDFGVRECANRLTDGRAASWLVETYAQNVPWMIGGKQVNFVSLPDLPVSLGADGHFIINRKEKLVGVRCLTSKVDFQRSMYLGKSRPRASNQIMAEDLGKLDYYIVCDISKNNYWKYWLIESPDLIARIFEGTLTYTGWSRERFYRFLGRNGYKIT